MSTELLMSVQLASTAFMCGVIWVVQLLVYPNFLHIPEENFLNFHKIHSSKITWIVGPAMGIELLCAAILLFNNSGYFFVINFLSVGVLWLQTAFMSIPLHNDLSKKYSTQTVLKLVYFNWIRSLVWSLRVLLLVSYIYL